MERKRRTLALIDCFASLPHYRDHLLPIWRELDRRGLAGEFFTAKTELGGAQITGRQAQRTDRPMMCASYSDAVKWQSRPVIYVEHGAGQTYLTDKDSQGLSGYSGGDRLENVALFIGPSQTVADRWLARYPGCTAVAVGCPRLDRWHQEIGRKVPTIPTVAITFHWDVSVIPETRWARPHYQDRFGELRDAIEGRGWRLLGHGHPREQRAMAEFYGRHGVQWVPDLATVFDTADLLIADNTSALPEFCSLGRPVIWLSAPWYRRDVEHGARFWSWPRGQCQANDMDELLAVLDRAMEDPPEVRAARQTMVDSIYLACDGKAAVRAVDAIEALF